MVSDWCGFHFEFSFYNIYSTVVLLGVLPIVDVADVEIHGTQLNRSTTLGFVLSLYEVHLRWLLVVFQYGLGINGD